jgi:predicted phosphodiesterase
LQEIPELFKSNWIRRTYQTPADQYYQKYGEIPLPRILHAVLDHGRLKSRMDSMDPNDDEEGIFSETTARTVAADHDKDETSSSHKILIVGDVHGCLDELKALVTKASMLHNDQKEFAAVILVGDLCNKGPYSAEMIQYVRSRRKRNWFSVRGNHDNAALAAALGDVHRQAKKKYDWVHSLSDEDVEWMSTLPYTITIRKEHLVAGNDIMKKRIQDDVIVVHAGLLPGLLSLEDQSIETMTTLRDVVKGRTQHQQEEEQTTSESCDAWAKLWHGPEFIIFGHDAKRGLQKEKYAIGLDTGACYGKMLTGIVLPDEEFVSVDSFQSYCGITTKNSDVEV